MPGFTFFKKSKDIKRYKDIKNKDSVVHCLYNAGLPQIKAPEATRASCERASCNASWGPGSPVIHLRSRLVIASGQPVNPGVFSAETGMQKNVKWCTINLTFKSRSFDWESGKILPHSHLGVGKCPWTSVQGQSEILFQRRWAGILRNCREMCINVFHMKYYLVLKLLTWFVRTAGGIRGII